MRELQALNDGANRLGLRSPETIVLQVQIVDDRCDSTDGSLGNIEPVAEGLEGAVLPVVTELDLGHIEWQGLVRDRAAIDHELKPRLGIDESTDEPCGRHAIDPRPRPRHPQSTTKFVRTSTVRDNRLSVSIGRTHLRVELPEKCDHSIATGRGKEVQPFGRTEALTELLEHLRGTGQTAADAATTSAQPTNGLLQFARERVVRSLARLLKCVDQSVVG